MINSKDKIKNWAEAKTQIDLWKSKEQNIVFTNGCFDLLHYGHVHYLEEAKAMGNYLVVGLNSDSSVQILKGESRPINDEISRANILAALASVDMVVVFEEETPKKLISHLLPDILVKGGDYSIDTIVGAKEIISNGGEVRVLSFLEGYSSTKMIKKIKGT